MRPEASVIITTHNRPQLLSRAINSVLKQNFDGLIEILIIDDSVDASIKHQNWMIVDQFDSANIKYTSNQFKKGVSGARNTGIQISKSDFLAFLDDDDTFSSNIKLQYQLDVFKTNQGLGIVGTNFQLVDKDGIIIRQIVQPETHEQIYNNFNLGGGICFGSSMIKKSILDSIGGFNTKLSYGEDTDLIYRVLKKSQGYNIQDYMLNYTQRSGNSCTSTVLPRVQGFNILLKNGKEFPNYYKGLLRSGANCFVPSSIRNTGLGSKIAKLIL